MRIVFLGLSGVPFSKRAIDVRLEASIHLFMKLGYDVDILNRYGSVPEDLVSDGYHVINPFGGKQRNKLLKILLYVIAYLYEPFRIIGMNWKKHIDVLFVNSGHFIDMVIYWIVSRLIGAKVVYQYCEYRASFETGNPYHKCNGKLICKYGPTLWDGAICITTFLEDDCKKKNPKVKTLKMYPICDYSNFVSAEKHEPGYKYIMFCGSVEYREVVNLIINSYNSSYIKNTCKLLMVLRGNKQIIEEVQRENPHTVIKSNLDYADLIAHYKGAFGLLIPLRNNIRDIARFPNKVCEYCASGNPIVTTGFGEMQYLFKDGTNAFVAEDFTVDQYSKALDRLAACENIDEIGVASFKLGLNNFDINYYLDSMGTFIENVVEK